MKKERGHNQLHPREAAHTVTRQPGSVPDTLDWQLVEDMVKRRELGPLRKGEDMLGELRVVVTVLVRLKQAAGPSKREKENTSAIAHIKLR